MTESGLRGAVVEARHKAMMGAAAVVLLGLALQRSRTPPCADTPALHSVTPIQSAAPQAQPIELLERIEGSFKDIYLTQISIIQGVAFGFLARSALTGPSPSASQWLAYGTAFIVIVGVWQEYMVGSTAFTWVPTMLDSVAPYLLGVLEFLIIVQVRDSTGAFLAMIAVTECICLIACINWWLHARGGGPVNRNSYLLIGRYVRFSMACHVLWTCPVSILLAVVYRYIGAGRELVFIAGTIVMYTPLFLHSIVNWTLPLYRLQRERGW
ncbi:hypothetical protein E1264_22425 [Actinomadura sp. KC216]|uniref:hypothetical protein n=1 Tax=Actinomadura sp. KC216 TaxID=2530370 RepID=UPI00104CB111|nr:hypothetical protein [Actinomadura sp. KC216]TDB85053.1 hypothetical protein E1264_22425 [Actinomadura sp. KC216]